jgi:uncharacterized protein (TIGR00645 family)
MSLEKKTEHALEVFLFNSRWALVPLYVGMLLTVLILSLKFVQEFIHMIPHILSAPASQLILDILSLIDILLIANLIMIIVFSGYENFVSKLEILQDHVDRPEWMGKVDYNGLKLKVIGSVVAISSIELLRGFMNIQNLDDKTLAWMVGIHAMFVVSGVLFALMEKLHHSKD